MESHEALARAPIFSELKPSLIRSLARTATTKTFRANEIITREGEDAVAFHVLCEGQADVIKGLGTAAETTIGHLTAGDFFGEMALLDEFPRVATVRATTDCECVSLIRWDFMALLRTTPEVALAILPVLSRRLRACEDQLLP